MRTGEALLDGPPARYVLDGDIYALTGDWAALLEHLAYDAWHLPLLLDLTQAEDAEVLRDRIHDPEDDLEISDVTRIAERLVLTATGQPWWVVQSLLLGAKAELFKIHGDLKREGVDLPGLIRRDPAGAVSVIYSWMTRDADEKERGKFHSRVFTPPPEAFNTDAGQDTLEDIAAAEGAAFMAAMGNAKRDPVLRQGARTA